MNRLSVLVLALTASFGAAAADPLADPISNDYGVRVRYNMSFGGHGLAPLGHSLGLISAPMNNVQAVPALEYRWAGNNSDFRLGGVPVLLNGSRVLNADNDKGGVLFLGMNVEELALAGGAIVVTVFVVAYNANDDGNPTGSGASK
jgi:hypothetical protein